MTLNVFVTKYGDFIEIKICQYYVVERGCKKPYNSNEHAQPPHSMHPTKLFREIILPKTSES